ncbi:MAG TPA: FAD-binding oxidoreductase [Candidatus Nanoarchaeia archaeon]|nr:FAD-binding oxidoreductase [Candidatus Nanoarchaeia archaeon]
MFLRDEIKSFFKGDIADDPQSLVKYSHDASLFEVKPQLVVFPKDSEDIQKLVKFVADRKDTDQSISLTARSAGTCMSGGSLNNSIIMDVTKYMHGIRALNTHRATVLPGTYYRDFEKETLKIDSLLPCYTASKDLCALGGMIANNCAGEKTLQYGKMEDYIEGLKVIFADGKEYEVKPLSKSELDKKMAQGDFEGNVYKQIFELIETNKGAIMSAKPVVSKNSAGYYLWNVWDGETFDLTKLIVGSQGTLGIVTEAQLRLVPVKKKTKLFVIFMPNIKELGKIVNEILETKPESVESYDDSTMKLAIRFLPQMMKNMKSGFVKLMFSFIPEFFMILTGGIPKLVLLVEFAGNDEKEIDKQLADLKKRVAHFKFKTRSIHSIAEAEKYWTIRRESFNLLRQHVHGLRTAPFVDDVVVRPEFLPEFLPKMRAILDEYKLIYTIAGHAGNGNFHIIPLMDMKVERNRELIAEVSDRIYTLVLKYHGSITGEHNDGIVRTPYLKKMYGQHIVDLFAQTKRIFDPKNIFNPGKKVGITLDYMESHIAKS